MAMDCRQAAELGTRIVSGNGSTADEAELQKHHFACAPCRNNHARIAKVWAMMGALPQIALSPAAARMALPVAPRRRAWLVGAVAAATLLGLLGFVLFRSHEQAPSNTSRVPAPPSPAPDEPKRESTRQEIERIRVEKLLEPETPVPQQPEAPQPKKIDPPAVPVPTQKAEVPIPPQPEQKQVAREENPTQKAPLPEKPQPSETTLVAGTLDRAEGSVFLVVSGTKSAAKPGQPIPAGAGIETVGAGSQAVLEYADGSRVALGGDTILLAVLDRRAPAGKPAEGKQIQISQGVLAAQVARQPAGEPMVFLTPHAEAKVVGTRLSLSVVPASTRLDVRQGRVKLTRRDDGISADVTEGHYAMAGKGLAPSAKAAPGPKIILFETFDRGKWSAALSQGGDTTSGLRFSTETGSLAIQMAQKTPPEISPSVIVPVPGGKLPPDVAKKAIDSVTRGATLGAKGDQPRALWLETRQAFALSNDTPLRLRARAWQSNGDADRTAWIAVNRASAGQSLSLERRGTTLQLWSEAAQAAVWKKDLPSVQEWESLELWLSKDQVVVRRNDLTVYSGPNPLKVKVVQLSFGGNAKGELAQDSEVRFDDVELSWTTKADLEDVTR